ncbi:MAG: translational GTPase TypA [Deltaproteobacteria bacterium]|nr:translational GTPase TypA [Deltaproteobacteria bacterium]
MSLRNIAIVAHVDHGKTTLVDAMLKQSGVFRDNEVVQDRVLDSNDLERERGITILAKNTSVRFRDTKINIIDTPGHADFGGEVERTLMMADGALLLVDAAEGPLPQTRFVLKKCLEAGFPIIVAINKIDRSDARAHEVLSEVFDLFCDLEASDAQADFPILYTNARAGIAHRELGDPSQNLLPLFETILERIPEPHGDPAGKLQTILCTLDYDDYVGRIAIGKVVSGTLRPASLVALVGKNATLRGKVTQVYRFEGLERQSVSEAEAGEVVAIAGMEEFEVGDTISDPEAPEPLPRIQVEEPTLKMRIGVNTSGFAGREGRFLTSRQLRERLFKEARKNVAIRVEDGETADVFVVYGRGELQLAILVETMRREGYEMQLSNPEVVVREIDGQRMEPVERVVVDVPEAFIGVVTERLGRRRGQMTRMSNPGYGRARLEFRLPSRGLIGFRGEFLTETRGTGLCNAIFDGWQLYSGPMLRRPAGAIVADRAGVATPYALFHLQPRGTLFIDPGQAVYEGMIIGEHCRPSDLDVNAIKEKKLSMIRNHGKDENVILAVPPPMGLERCMEWIDRDELVEVTPAAIRLRKVILSCERRPRRDVED